MSTVTKPYGDFVNNVDVADAVKVNAQVNTLYNGVNGGLDYNNVPSLGNPANLQTTVKDTFTNAINEVNTKGTLDFLTRQIAINGNFDVWQRGTSFTNAGYGPDRWYLDISASTLSRQTIGVPVGSQYIARMTMAASGYVNIYQAFESDTCKKLAGKTVTFPVKLRRNGSFGSTIVISVQKNASADTLTGPWTTISSTTISNASLPTGITAADWFDASVKAIIPNDGTANGLRIAIEQGTAQAAGAYYEVAQADPAASDVVIPFQPRSLAEVWFQCLRYCEKSYDIDTAPGTNTIAGEVIGQASGSVAASTAGAIISPCHDTFKVPKRTTPTTTIYSTDGTANAVLVSGGTNRTGATATGATQRKPLDYISLSNVSATPIGDRNQIQYHWMSIAEIL
jgi:hypothetical protein